MKKNNRKIKQYVIIPEFQVSIVKYFAFLFLLVGLVNISSVFFFFYTFKNHGLAVGLSANHTFYRFIQTQEQLLYTFMGIALAVCLLILIIGGFMLSHKVAGPLYRLREHMKNFNKAESDLTRVKFRKGDYFEDIQDEFNKLVIKLESKQKK